MTETIKIGGELESMATGNVVAAASAIKDKAKDKYQSTINAETDVTLAQHASAINGLNSQNYVSVAATDQTTDITDVLPATGEADTVYRVGNWDGSQFDVSVYSEYAWNGNQYVHLSTKTQIEEVFDISAYHATGGTLATYADLSAALDSNNGGGVPQSLQKGGMSVKYVCSSDNKYVQARLMAQNFTTDVTQWQGVDDELTKDSNNLAKSGSAYPLKATLDGVVIDNGTTYSEKYESTNRTAVFYPIEKGKRYKVKIDNIDNQTQSYITIALTSSKSVYSSPKVMSLGRTLDTSFEREFVIPNGVENAAYLAIYQIDSSSSLCSFRVNFVQEKLDEDIFATYIIPIDDRIGWVRKEISWFVGRVSTTGTVYNNDAKDTLVSQPISMNAGEKLKIHTNYENIAVISSASQDSIAIGDILTVIKYTTGTYPEGNFEYIATEAVKIVLCFNINNYSFEFSKDNYLDVEIGSLDSLHTTDKTSLVNAINEVYDKASDIDEEMGESTSTTTYGSESYCGKYYSNSSDKVLASASSVNGVLLALEEGREYDFSALQDAVTIWSSVPNVNDTSSSANFKRKLTSPTHVFTAESSEAYALFTLVFSRATSVTVTASATGLRLVKECITNDNNIW